LIEGSYFVSGAVYVDDVAEAVIKACYLSSARTNRKIFNLADPVKSRTWRKFYEELSKGLDLVTLDSVFIFSVPHFLAVLIAYILEFIYRLFGWYHNTRPLMTHFLLRLVGQDQDWPIAAAERDLHWRPRTPFKTGMERTVQWLAQKPELKRKRWVTWGKHG
jgi:nucleoside-diphosphate-sugar epimerase